MFGLSRQKTHQAQSQTDVKKSTVKLLDCKRDVPTRLKHLRLILDSVDIHESKSFFSMHYSHIYHLVYEGIVQAEGAIRLRGENYLAFATAIVHKAQREELESVLYLLERILMLLPDLLHCRWQLHSMSRLMAKLNHPGNSLRLRREAIRLFLMWYQCLGTNAPVYVHAMFASLVPGIGSVGTDRVWPPTSASGDGIAPHEITPVLPCTPGERLPEDISSVFMESLLDFLVSQAPRIHWNEGGAHMWGRSIEFLYERFKEYYIPKIFPDFVVTTDIYKPHLELVEPRKSADLSNNPISNCQVVFIKWIANYAHSVYRNDYSHPVVSSMHHHSHDDSHKMHLGAMTTPPSSLSGGGENRDRDSITSNYSSCLNNDVDANVLAKEVILGSRANINFLHEVFRRGLLMNFVHSAAIRRVICVYKDWIQINVPELPVFMLEPEIDQDHEDSDAEPSKPVQHRLRTDSYQGAIGINANNNREEYLSHLRAGAQKVLQVFFCNSSAVFLLFQIPKHEAAVALLEEQVDVCKRVLNIYRYAVMNTRMDQKTWSQLLVVILHVTSKVLDLNTPHCGLKYPDTLGYKLASALFQTLIVSWVKASLNVPIPLDLWDQLQSVLSQLTFSDDLITEWSKTMETLTRVLSRHVYNLDLANLPLDRRSEQTKAKRKRGGGGASGGGSSSTVVSGATSSVVASHQHQIVPTTPMTIKRNSDVTDIHTYHRNRHISSSGGSGLADQKSLPFSPNARHGPGIPGVSKQGHSPLRRSLSENSVFSPRKHKAAISQVPSVVANAIHNMGHIIAGPAGTSNSTGKWDDIPFDRILIPEQRIRKRSRSMDSLKKSVGMFTQQLSVGVFHPDWAEISSSTATSLENVDTATIQIDGDSNSIDCGSESSSNTATNSKPSDVLNRRSGVIQGGQIKGWLPAVAAILWRRMLGILGDVNAFTNPKTHTHFFQVLTELSTTLFKVRDNQGVTADNMSTPRPPELVPPIMLVANWCLQSRELPDEFHRGKVLACALLCDITMTNQDIPFNHQFLTKFYSTIHHIIISKEQELIHEVVKRCGLKYIPKMLPGFTLLSLDLIQAAHSILSSDDLKKAPRMESATLLASLLTVSEVCRDLPTLQPNSLQFQLSPSNSTKQIVYNCLVQFAKIEQTSQARCIALQALAILLCKELNDIKFGIPYPTQNQMQRRVSVVSPDQENRVSTIFNVLLASVKVANRNVALVASDLLLLLSEYAGQVAAFFPSICKEVVKGLKTSLQQALPLKSSTPSTSGKTNFGGKPAAMEKRLLISLMLTLGEWCMRIPLELLLESATAMESSLLSSVFEVLLMVNKGFQGPTSSSTSGAILLEDFDPSVPFDDLQPTDRVQQSDASTSSFHLAGSSVSQEQHLNTVRLAAKALMMHLLTQLGHYPITQGSSAPRCNSIVSENDDLPGLGNFISSELEELQLNSSIFTQPNIQMFAMDDNTLLSIVEIPALPSGNSDGSQDATTSGQGTASNDGNFTSSSMSPQTQVRIILRDLTGKASWDASHVSLPTNYSCDSDIQEPELPAAFQNNEDMSTSTMTGTFFLPQIAHHRHPHGLVTLRRRPVGILPTFGNSAFDMDNLDDCLQYIGYTSPECLLRSNAESLTTPWEPPASLTQSNEDDVVANVVNQRNTELEFLWKFDQDLTMRSRPVVPSSESQLTGESITSDYDEESNLPSLTASTKSAIPGPASASNPSPSSAFILSRRLFSHLSLPGWDKRSQIHLLNKDEKLLREIKHLDSQKCREAHKIAVIYVAHGQEDKYSILSNTGGSEAFEEFVAGLGWEIELESHTGFLGGLQRNNKAMTGETAPYYATSFSEVLFHVSTRMPSQTEESLLNKTRHLGNDEVWVVWSEHWRDFRRDIIPTEFCDVLIVIYPLEYGLFRVQINRKPEVPYFGPLYNEAVIERDTLAILVRATALNASRARRSSLQFFQHYFEERSKALSTIIQNHKSRTTFEHFAANVFCPLLPPTSFHSGTRPLASYDVAKEHSHANSSDKFMESSTSSYSSLAAPPSPLLPPVPPKRLSIKSSSQHAFKPKILTPPASPATNLKR